eukprot:TRINITY_DN104592_c0_g1_i1.p1 TRINITY_DN104592_c0_g1~~TRINITY_DN104592_c0_g1_i1.p1  ORF type:complete len:301 (-),score=20.78 TRINITY_DN104592_c0_g1_i1:109-1011(-)
MRRRLHTWCTVWFYVVFIFLIVDAIWLRLQIAELKDECPFMHIGGGILPSRQYKFDNYSEPKEAHMQTYLRHVVPISIVDVSSLLGPEPEQFHRNLAQYAEQELKLYKSDPVRDPEYPDEQDENNNFFFWQKRQWSTHKAHPRAPDELGILKAHIKKAVGRYLKTCGEPNPIRKVEDIFIWAAVHSNGVYHALHTHEDASVSGVFYAQAPPGSGNLEFADLRGSGLPPFDEGKWLYAPQPGQLLLFPSYYPHQVWPTQACNDSNPRVVFAFNVGDSWNACSNVNLETFKDGQRIGLTVDD